MRSQPTLAIAAASTGTMNTFTFMPCSSDEVYAGLDERVPKLVRSQVGAASVPMVPWFWEFGLQWFLRFQWFWRPDPAYNRPNSGNRPEPREPEPLEPSELGTSGTSFTCL